jgi:hypothetical protein
MEQRGEVALKVRVLSMSARPSAFKTTDLARAIRGARAGGVEIGRVIVDKNGAISIVPREPREKPTTIAPPLAAELKPEPWD